MENYRRVHFLGDYGSLKETHSDINHLLLQHDYHNIPFTWRWYGFWNDERKNCEKLMEEFDKWEEINRSNYYEHITTPPFLRHEE